MYAIRSYYVIHDFELALMGHTSEEVDTEIDEGRFGMAEETGRMLNDAIVRGHRDREGLGEAVGHYIRITSYNVCYTKLLRSGRDVVRQPIGSHGRVDHAQQTEDEGSL